VFHAGGEPVSLVGIATGYGLDDRGSRVWFPAGAGNLSLHHRVQNTFLSNGYWGFFRHV